MKKGIKEVLQTEMLDFTAPLLINNLPAIDGLLVSQRQVIYAMNKAHMNSNGAFYKMLKATGKIFDFYVLGDAPLTGVMKNMGNNYVLNKYLIPKGSFGNKNMRDGTGASPRYIECKLDKYSECMLEGINKNSVEMKWNYDATEREPIIFPSKIPNILVNLRMSISVSEANKMPSHNLVDSCDSIISYIETRDIEKSIDILKAPDLPSKGVIIYNKKTFDQIYKTGKGSFTNIGKTKFDEKKNILTIYEIPYTTYIENIYDEIEKNIDKFDYFIEEFHDGTDRNGLALNLYLKRGISPDVVIQKLRKYTSFESKFSCNFTILDLDGKTPVLCGLENLIQKWLTHRIICIKNEFNFDYKKYENRLHLLVGLKSLLPYLDEVITTIRNSSNDNESIELISKKFNLDKEQAEYVVGIKLLNLNKDFINKRLKDINILQEKLKDISQILSSDKNIENIIKEQLEEIKIKFGDKRKTEILYEDNLAKVDTSKKLVEDYNCRILLTNTFIKKHLKLSTNHKLKDGDKILCDISSNNKSTLFAFSDKGNRYKIKVNDLKTFQPSGFGSFIPEVIPKKEPDENILKVFSIDKEEGYMIFIFENGKIAKINIESYLSNNKCLTKCFNSKSPLVDMFYIEKDTNLMLISSEGKGLILDTSTIEPKLSKSSQGIACIKTKEHKVIGCVIDIKNDDGFELLLSNKDCRSFEMNEKATKKSSEKRSLFEYLQGNKGTQGNFIINTRKSDYEIIGVKKL